jgi:putative transposase
MARLCRRGSCVTRGAADNSGMDSPHRKTRKAWNEPGHAHFLTYSCFHRWPLLSKDRSRRWVLDGMEATRDKLDVALWAYVVMPEHVHIVLCPRRDRYDMRLILASLKRGVSKEAKNHLVGAGRHDWIERLTVTYPRRTVFRFWEPGGGHDHNIFRRRTLKEVVDYVHANPVRRGLVARPTDWYWSSARYWRDDDTGPLRMDHPSDR